MKYLKFLCTVKNCQKIKSIEPYNVDMYRHFPYIIRCEEYVVYSITFPSHYKPALKGLCFTLSYQHRTFESPPPLHLPPEP